MQVSLNNVSFQGKFTTPMQGRNGILKDVSLVFEHKTKGLNGSLEVAKGNNVLLLKFNDKKVPFKISNYGDLTGANFQEKTPEAINSIAESYAKVFRILKTQATFEKLIKKLKTSRSKTEVALNANKKSYELALTKNNKTYDKMYLSMIEKNNVKLNKIKDAENNARLRYNKFINNIADKDSRALQYIETIL